MLRYLLPLALIACTVAGCTPAASSQPVAETRPAAKYPTLAAGQAVMVAGHAVVMVENPSGKEWPKDSEEFILPVVHEGDRGLVIDDLGPPESEDRHVKLRMESGTRAGRTYLIGRDELVPLSTPPR